jgi:membrane associated rhomboid family serine protease
MMFLYVFGRKIEEYLGSIPYVIFYIIAGYAAIGGHLLLGGIACSAPGSYEGLIVGASGAVAGLMGAFLFLHPNVKIRTIVMLLPPLSWSAKVPAVFFLVYWFASNFLAGIGWMGEEATNVAYWAHIGGFLFGFLVVFITTMLWKPAPRSDPFAYLDD